jgi:hypothetical protein
MQQGISQPVFMEISFINKTIKGNVNVSRLFVKTICKFKKKCYQHDILQRSVGLVINPSTLDHYAYLFGCTMVAGV